METITSFKDLKVWQKSVDLAVLIYRITGTFSPDEKYGLISQMRRAAISVSSNIAEGFDRSHAKEKLQFYQVAHASLAELESQASVALQLKFIKKKNIRN